MHQPSEARKLLEGAQVLGLQDDPHFDIQFQLENALILEEENNHERSISVLDGILEKYEGHLRTPLYSYWRAAINYQRGLALVNLHRFDHALAALHDAVSSDIDPANKGSAHHLIGLCYYNLGHYDKAREALLNALQIPLTEPYRVRTHYYLERLTKPPFGQHPWAQQHLREILGICGGNYRQVQNIL